jgi:hypothetical protein
VTDEVVTTLQKSFASAEALAAQPQYAQYSDQIVEGARTAFLQGANWAYVAGIVAVLAGAGLVFRFFPRFEDETRLLAQYRAEDAEHHPAV